MKKILDMFKSRWFYQITMNIFSLVFWSLILFQGPIWANVATLVIETICFITLLVFDHKEKKNTDE